LAKTQQQQNDLETQLDAVRKRIYDQKAEIAELYDLQDTLEQYTRKNSLKIHGVPESAYTSSEEDVLKLAEAIDGDINPNDIQISHKLQRRGVKPIIVKFQSHKVKATNYRNLVLTTMNILDLMDIQRERHLKLCKYSYESKVLKVKSRIDFFLVVKKCEIYPSRAPDHKAIYISLSLSNETPRGRRLCEFNNCLLNNENYVKHIFKLALLFQVNRQMAFLGDAENGN